VADIFLSYSREDARRAEALSDALIAAGHTVWWDRKLTAGERYSEETESYLKGARVVLVLWSRFAVKSVWVRDEAAVGRDMDKLVPVAFDGVEPPIGFRQIQALPVDDSAGEFPEDSFRILTKAIARKLGLEIDPEREAPESRPTPARKATAAAGRGPLLAALAAALAAAIIYFAAAPYRTAKEADAMPPGATLTVPPFEVEGANASLAGLATGLTHGMRSMLRERGFDVRGYQFPDQAEDVSAFIGKLGVDYVVRGTIVEIGDALLYNVDIVGAKSERAVASFQMQENSRTDLAIVRRILDRVAETLAPKVQAAGPVSEDADFYIALGLVEDAANQADFAAARTLFERVVKRDPDDARAHALYAYTLASIDRYAGDSRTSGEAAGAAIERALALGGADSDAYFARAVHHYIYGEDFARLDLAEKDLQRAIAFDAGNMRALRWLMNVQIQKGDYSGAIKIADRALKLSPDYRDVQGNRISAQLSLGDRDGARGALDALLEETPDWAWGRRFRASIAITDGDFDRARAEISRAESLDAVGWNAELLAVVESNDGPLAAARAAIDLQAERTGLDPAWVTYKKAIIAGDVEAGHSALKELVAREIRPRQRAQALVASGFMNLYENEPAPAREECAESARLSLPDANREGPPELAEVCAGIASARLGDVASAKALIARFERARASADRYRPYWSESLYAALQAEIGDRAGALATIDGLVKSGWRTPKTALCRHCVHLSVADSRGLFAQLVEEPRFHALMAMIGAEET
jgi:tetratricopeptide (TPR) repeat protein